MCVCSQRVYKTETGRRGGECETSERQIRFRCNCVTKLAAS